MDALSQLPTDGTTFDQLRSYDEIDDVNDETDADMGGNEPRPEQGNATGDAAGDETINIVEAHANINHDHEIETMQQGALNISKEELNQNENGNAENLGTVNNPMPFPQSTNILNDYIYPFMQSLAFPALFPNSKEGDVPRTGKEAKCLRC